MLFFKYSSFIHPAAISKYGLISSYVQSVNDEGLHDKQSRTSTFVVIQSPKKNSDLSFRKKTFDLHTVSWMGWFRESDVIWKANYI